MAGESCAACGKSSENLRKCTACKLVSYCNVDCQRSHRKAHRKLCKERAAELKAESEADAKARDLSKALLTNLSLLANAANGDDDDDAEDLFAPNPPRTECPICTIPLPLDITQWTYAPCCGKDVCGACIHENQRIIYEENVKRSEADPPRELLSSCCPFCRVPTPRSNKDILDRCRKRMEANDARAICNMANRYRNGITGLDQDHAKALELEMRAAELGSLDACYNLAVNYRDGVVVKKDVSKERHYLKIAAKGGVISARFNLGNLEQDRGNIVAARKHWLIAAAGGHKRALDVIAEDYRFGALITKKEYENVLRAYHKTHEDARSEARDKYAAHRAAGGKPYPALTYENGLLTPP